VNVSKLELFVGLALMSWGSAGITKALELTGWHQFDVILFAFGIILLAQVQNRSLDARLRELEKERVPKNPLNLPAQG
jgi:hypothetical protein